MYRRGTVWWSSIGGVRTSLRTENKADAEEFERRLKQQHYRQEFLGASRPRSWEESCLRWEKENRHKVSWQDDVRIIRWWTAFFAGWDIRRITREGVDEIIQKHRPVTPEASSQNNTANHYVVGLASILNAAARKWDWIERAPLLRRYQQLRGRERWLNLGEWRSLEQELPPYLLQAARFALATGMRRGKLVQLRWAQVDYKTRALGFAGTENKLGNTIPLNITAMSVLEEIQASPVRHMNLVFTRPDGTPFHEYERGWYSALEKCGLRRIAAAQVQSGPMMQVGRGSTPQPASAAPEDVCWHTLRHTWASWLAQAGVPEWARKRLGGWSSRETVDRYSHLSLEALRPYAAVIDTLLAQGADQKKATA